MFGAPGPIPLVECYLICQYVQNSGIDNRTNGILYKLMALSQLSQTLRTMVTVSSMQDITYV